MCGLLQQVSPHEPWPQATSLVIGLSAKPVTRGVPPAAAPAARICNDAKRTDRHNRRAIARPLGNPMAMTALPLAGDRRYCTEHVHRQLRPGLSALRRYRPVPHGIMGTVEMAFWGDPSTNLSLIAR